MLYPKTKCWQVCRTHLIFLQRCKCKSLSPVDWILVFWWNFLNSYFSTKTYTTFWWIRRTSASKDQSYTDQNNQKYGQPYQWITSGLAPRQCSLATMLVSLPQCSLLGVHRVDWGSRQGLRFLKHRWGTIREFWGVRSHSSSWRTLLLVGQREGVAMTG